MANHEFLTSGIGEVKNLLEQQIKAPTCQMYEPNFLKVFGYARHPGNVTQSGNILNEFGIVVATIMTEQEVIGIKRWVSSAPSDICKATVIVKNPDKIDGHLSTVGIRNGVLVENDVAFALKVNSNSLHITRPVIPMYQAIFVEQFRKIDSHGHPVALSCSLRASRG